jgi:hypothetical protein
MAVSKRWWWGGEGGTRGSWIHGAYVLVVMTHYKDSKWDVKVVRRKWGRGRGWGRQDGESYTQRRWERGDERDSQLGKSVLGLGTTEVRALVCLMSRSRSFRASYSLLWGLVFVWIGEGLWKVFSRARLGSGHGLLDGNDKAGVGLGLPPSP